ncbi:MAG: FliM/FliN family flagellar motor switch protein [Thiotrichales bacterium]
MPKKDPPLFADARGRVEESSEPEAVQANRPSMLPGKSSDLRNQPRQEVHARHLPEKIERELPALTLHDRNIQVSFTPEASCQWRPVAAAKLFVCGEFFWVLLEDWPFPDKPGGRFDSTRFYQLPRDLRGRMLTLQLGGFVHLLNRYAKIQVHMVSDASLPKIPRDDLLEMEFGISTSRGDQTRACVLYPEKLLSVVNDLITDFFPEPEKAPPSACDQNITIKLCDIPITLGSLKRLTIADFIGGAADCLGSRFLAIYSRDRFVTGLEYLHDNQYAVINGSWMDYVLASSDPLRTPESIDDVVINLSVFLDYERLNEEEILSLERSDLVEIVLPLDEPVTLKIGRQIIGKGEIVGVGEDSAIRITELFAQTIGQ